MKKACKQCGRTFYRRTDEAIAKFTLRKYCNRECAGWAQRKSEHRAGRAGQLDPDDVAIPISSAEIAWREAARIGSAELKRRIDIYIQHGGQI